MGTPFPSPKGGAEPPKFSVHVYCGQTAGWMKLVLGMEVGLSQGDFVLDGDPAPSPGLYSRPGLYLRPGFYSRKYGICYRPSVCLSSITFVRPTQVVQSFGNISTALGTLASQGNPSAGGVKHEGQPSIAISDLSTDISRKRCKKIRGKLVLMTNRKSYISFRLVPKSVTLNNLERRKSA